MGPSEEIEQIRGGQGRGVRHPPTTPTHDSCAELGSDDGIWSRLGGQGAFSFFPSTFEQRWLGRDGTRRERGREAVSFRSFFRLVRQLVRSFGRTAPPHRRAPEDDNDSGVCHLIAPIAVLRIPKEEDQEEVARMWCRVEEISPSRSPASPDRGPGTQGPQR